MSARGTAIFSDDTACDVRNEFNDLISEGNDSVDATNIMIERWQDIGTDPDEALVFWLALAATQWKIGRLDERTKEKALSIIENGNDLLRWYHENDPKGIARMPG